MYMHAGLAGMQQSFRGGTSALVPGLAWVGAGMVVFLGMQHEYALMYCSVAFLLCMSAFSPVGCGLAHSFEFEMIVWL